MAYKPREIYRGRRKFKVPLTFFLFVLAGLLILAVVLFYGLQRFLVYDQSGVTLQLPGFSDASEEPENAAEEAAPSDIHPDPVYAEMVYLSPSFEDISLAAGENVSQTKAYFLEYANIIDAVTLATNISAAKGLGCTSVVMEMKPRTGQLAWASLAPLATDYGTAGVLDYTDAVASIHAQGMTAAAQLSCCADTLMSTRNWTMSLRTMTGAPWSDSSGVYWLDPYNHTVRAYLNSLCEELLAMGFDEIIFADLYHPQDEAGFTYTVTLHADPSPKDAVCQLARSLAEGLAGRETLTGGTLVLSAVIDTASLRAGNGEKTGQDLSVFGKLFDYFYCATDASRCGEDASSAGSYLGNAAPLRFVPLFTSSVPEGTDVWALRIPVTK